LNAKLVALGVDIELPMPSFRTHGQSEESELTDLLAGWAGGSIDITGMQPQETESTDDTPDYLSNVLDSEARKDILDALMQAQVQASELKGPVRRVVDQGLFHLMQRASYSEENLGHFGLNLDAYVHFTSPIRRYPDLMTHRQLKAHLRGEDWVHSLEDTAKISSHCSRQGHTAKRMEWEMVANAYHLHLLRGGTIGGESTIESTPLEHTSWAARITGLRTPWIFLDLADDGAIHGRMHLGQLGGKTQMSVDEFGLSVIPSEPDQRGEQNPVVQLGQIFPCRLRGLDVWAGTLDLAPQ
jgi:exoribonuclease R